MSRELLNRRQLSSPEDESTNFEPIAALNVSPYVRVDVANRGFQAEAVERIGTIRWPSKLQVERGLEKHMMEQHS